MSETDFQRSKEESLKLPESVAGLPARYEIIELLGQGGMALVYKAMDRPLIRTVAIKVLLNTDKLKSLLRQYQIRELRAREATGEEKKVKASDLFAGIHTIVLFYREQKQYDLAAKYAQKLEPVAKIIDGEFENFKAKYYMDLACCFMSQKKNPKRIQYLEKGLACRMNDLECRSYLAQYRGLCYLQDGDLQNFEKCLKLVAESAVDKEIKALEYSQTKVGTKMWSTSLRFFNGLAKDFPEEVRDCKDQAGILRIYLFIAENLIEQGCFEQRENLIKSIYKLRVLVPKDAPEYKQLIDRSDKVLKQLSAT